MPDSANPTRSVPEEHVAFLQPGEQREFVRGIADESKCLGADRLPYDEWFEYYLAGMMQT